MPPKKTSTSVITLATIQQLIIDGIAATMEAQAADMTNTNNPVKIPESREISVAKKRKFQGIS